MTRNTNARVAGGTFLAYIAFGISAMMLSARGKGSGTVTEKLASTSQHLGDVRISILLSGACCFFAIVLGVTLYAITRDEDQDIAMFGLACRVAEGVAGVVSLPIGVFLLYLATSPGAGGGSDSAASRDVLEVLLRMESYGPTVTATLFAFGSLAFAWLFVRGDIIPKALAWLGVIASIILVIGLPLKLVGYLTNPNVDMMWIPMALFEVPLGFYLLIKGVRAPIGARMDDDVRLV